MQRYRRMQTRLVACLSSPARAAVLVQVTGTQLTLASQLSAQRRGQTLAPPGAGRDSVQHLQWCSTGQRVVLVSRERTPSCLAVRVSTFEGTQLVGSHLEALAAEESFRILHVSEDAATMLLTLRSAGGSRVVACTAEGAVTARHPSAHIASSTALLAGGCVLAASPIGDRLYIYSASCVQEISLQDTSAPSYVHPVVRSWGSQALVLLVSPAGAPHALLCVDLALQQVQRLGDLVYPQNSLTSYSPVAQGARSVALDLGNHQQVSIVATSGCEAGKELFRCQGTHPPMGRARQIPGCLLFA